MQGVDHASSFSAGELKSALRMSALAQLLDSFEDVRLKVKGKEIHTDARQPFCKWTNRAFDGRVATERSRERRLLDCLVAFEVERSRTRALCLL